MRAVVGLGFRQHTTCQALRQVLDDAWRTAQGGLTQPVSLQVLATAADKCGHPALCQLAAELSLPVQAVALTAVRHQQAQPSPHVPARYGAHSLAEAAALAGAGSGAVLVAHKHISTDHTATAAVAVELIDCLPT
ncbi:MAG: cobalamin biosynthesis protein [Burkholderiales bacterium]|nr:cobalamin biosynthesis protein [Burkholderiales bacterium]